MTTPGEHQLFRYGRGPATRIYSLRVNRGRTELWRVTIEPGRPDAAVMEDDFADVDACATFLEEVRRTLVAGGWKEVDD